MRFETWLQSRLTAHGYPVGVIDGVVGPKTVSAIRAFEAAHGLPVDGTADPTVVRALRASASSISPSDMTRVPDRDRDLGGSASPVARTWPRQSAVPSFFGAVGENQRHIEVPFSMRLAWDKNHRVRRITVHRKVAKSATRAFQKIAQIYSVDERAALGLDLFGGSLNVRRMRGGRSYSMHSWGIAIDFDPERNRLTWHRPRARLSHQDALPFWQIWEAEGWLSLGRARDFDWMHVQAARL